MRANDDGRTVANMDLLVCIVWYALYGMLWYGIVLYVLYCIVLYCIVLYAYYTRYLGLASWLAAV